MKASICIITYNHDQFIAETLESVLMQETDFPIEIIIGEDNSTDQTRTICQEYANKYPELIRLLPPEVNLGMMQNFLRTYRACSGEFIAFIEGDDYWNDPQKLQKQIDFLQANPDFSICFHNVILKFSRKNEQSEKPFHNNLHKDVFETEDLLQQWFIPSGAVVFRKYTDFIFPDWFAESKSGDIPFLLLMSLKGKIKYIDQIMGVYRIHDKGISTTHNGYDKIIAMVFIYENFNIYTKQRHSEKIKEAIIFEINRHLPKTEIATPKEIPKQNNFLSRMVKSAVKIFS